MAKLTSKNSQVMIEIDAVPTLIASCTDWALNCNRNTIDVSTLSTEWKEFAVGQIQADGSCNLILDSSDADAEQEVHDNMIAGTQVVMHVRPAGTGAGLDDYALPAFITTWNLSAGVEDAIRVAVNFTGAGPITKTAQPTA